MKTPIEINRMGYEALMNALGFDGTIRFLRQFDPGKGDYTTERHQRLNKITLEEIFTDIEANDSADHLRSELPVATAD